MGGQSGEIDQSGLLEPCFTLDGHFRQGSGESQGQKLRHAFQRRTRQSGKRNPAIQPCGTDKVVRVRSKATSDLCNTGATLGTATPSLHLRLIYSLCSTQRYVVSVFPDPSPDAPSLPYELC